MYAWARPANRGDAVTKSMRWFAAVAFCAVGVFFAVGAVRAEDKAAQEVRAVAGQFYAALNAMFAGDVAPMTAVWSHRNDVTYMGPAGGFRVGWTQVLADWQAQAALKLGGKVEPQEMRITAGRELAVVSNIEAGQNVVDGKTQTVTIRATNVFRKERGQWKMIAHHTDLLPYLQK